MSINEHDGAEVKEESKWEQEAREDRAWLRKSRQLEIQRHAYLQILDGRAQENTEAYNASMADLAEAEAHKAVNGSNLVNLGQNALSGIISLGFSFLEAYKDRTAVIEKTAKQDFDAAVLDAQTVLRGESRH